MFNKVDMLKKKLDELRPLHPDAVRRLREVFDISLIYNSNAIEGNTLTLLETKMVLEDGITISNKPLREHLEAINLKEALHFIGDIAGNNRRIITEKDVKDLHYLVLKSTTKDMDNCGRYRKVNVRISGSTHIPPEYFVVPDMIRELVCWYNKSEGKVHPVELSAKFHRKLVNIHPFIDGNGRTARMCMNLILMMNGFPPVTMKADENSKREYYSSLLEADSSGNEERFVNFVTKAVIEMLVDYLSLLDPDWDLDRIDFF